MDYKKIIQDFLPALSEGTHQGYDIIDEVEPGVKMPAEGLSKSHAVGVYCEKLPLKVSEHMDGFREISLGELLPVWEEDACLYLECVKLRGAKFRAEDLQYIEDGFAAMVDEVKYPIGTVLGAIWAIQSFSGKARLFLNDKLPMPLIVSAAEPWSIGGGEPAVCVQAFSGKGFIPTNIHVQVSMEYARVWVPGVHTYYKKV